MNPPGKTRLTITLLFLLSFFVLLFLARGFASRENAAAREEAIHNCVRQVEISMRTRPQWLLDYGRTLVAGNSSSRDGFSTDKALHLDSFLFKNGEGDTLRFERRLAGSGSSALARELEAALNGVAGSELPHAGILSLPSGPRWIARIDSPERGTILLTQRFSPQDLLETIGIPGLSLQPFPHGDKGERPRAWRSTEPLRRNAAAQATIRDMTGKPAFQLSFPLPPGLTARVNRQMNWWVVGMLAALFPVLLATLISRSSEHRYRSLFEESPIPLWEEDLTVIREHLEKLRQSGIDDLETYLVEHPETLREIAGLPRIRDVNDATVALYGARDKNDLLARLPQVFCHEGKDLLKREILAIARGDKTFECEGINYALDGKKLHVQIRWSCAPESHRYERVLLSVEDISERKQREDRLRFLRYHDPLTGVRNRAFFEEQLRRLDSAELNGLGILTLDVDGLKYINDSLGHQAGDELLRRTGAILKRSFRSSDLLTRIGGDEFVILLPSCDQEGLQSALKRLKDEVLQDLPTLSCPAPLSFSVGWAWGGRHRPSLETLIAQADRRMYAQKSRGRAQTLHRLSDCVERYMAAVKQDPVNVEGLQVLLGKLRKAISATDHGLPAPRT